jgi:drug/metabolite transporter (DMT)-like permease
MQARQMQCAAILIVIILLTLLGDHFIKVASQKPSGLLTPTFLLGALLYALPAVGWFYLMRSHSLAMIGVFYSAGTILVLAGLGYLVFGERIGSREVLGFRFAIAAVNVVSR